MFFLTEIEAFNSKGEKCSFSQNSFWNPKPSFSSQNNLSKKIECLDVFVWNLGLRARIAFENVSKQALNEPKFNPQEKNRSKNQKKHDDGKLFWL